MKYFIFIFLSLILFSCVVREGYVWEKIKEEYEENFYIDKIEHTKQEIQYRYDMWEDEWGYYPTQVHDYYTNNEYIIKDYPDFILVVKEKKGKNKTLYYVEEYIYDKLQIEHTYVQDIYRGSLWDFNNEKILIRTWRD